MTTVPPGPARNVKRDAILRAAPAAVGAAWARDVSARLAAEGRSVEGGWPGTIVEARALISGRLRAELVGRDLHQASSEELVAAAARTYDEARSAWLILERGTRASSQAARSQRAARLRED